MVTLKLHTHTKRNGKTVIQFQVGRANIKKNIIIIITKSSYANLKAQKKEGK